MALASDDLHLESNNVLGAVSRWAQQLFARADFSPEEALANAPGIDPRLVPRVKMSANDIDVHLLNELGKLGLKRGKLMTAESHPELMQAWQTMSQRAGLKQAPQLILVESKTINALTVTPEEMVVTTGLLKTLNLREVTAVLGHELGHGISDHHRPRLIARVGLGSLGALGAHTLAQRFGLQKWNRNSVLMTAVDEAAVLGVGAMVGTVVANQATVRPTELDADRKGAAISGDPQGLANALRKLGSHQGRNPVLNFFMHLKSGYPAVETRIEKLEEIARTMAATPQPVARPQAQPAVQPSSQVTGVMASERLGTPVEPSLGIN